MLIYLKDKKFIGDLSLQDADVLVKYAGRSRRVLEFGVGGSTQILTQCGCDTVTSVETDPAWIELTKKRVAQIKTNTEVNFLPYTTTFDQKFDLIFVDGVDHLRRQFAIDTWKYLDVGGVMIFHDTRRFNDFQNAAWVAQLYFNEIYRIDVNLRASDDVSSNMTVIHKKDYEPYVDWNYTENKPKWAYGGVPGTEESPLWEH